MSRTNCHSSARSDHLVEMWIIQSIGLMAFIIILIIIYSQLGNFVQGSTRITIWTMFSLQILNVLLTAFAHVLVNKSDDQDHNVALTILKILGPVINNAILMVIGYFLNKLKLAEIQLYASINGIEIPKIIAMVKQQKRLGFIFIIGLLAGSLEILLIRFT